MASFLTLIFITMSVFYGKLIFILNANPVFNLIILCVFVIGIIRLFSHVRRLAPEKKWLEKFISRGKNNGFRPSLLAPVAEMLKGHEGKSKPYIASTTLQSMLDIIDSRLSDDRDMARYFVNVLIFLGLLGTFFGLMQTIQSISSVIDNLSINVNDFDLMFQTLKNDLASPLGGMSTAFSSSLLGLSCSLILGYLTLQVSYSQNRFYNFTEEKLSSLTRISGDIKGVKKGEESIFSYLQALLEQTADSMNKLELSLAKSEHHHQNSAMKTQEMSERLIIISEKMHKDLGSMTTMAISYKTLQPLVEKLRDLSGNLGIDPETKAVFNSINTNITSMSQQLSSDLKILAKTISLNGSKK